MANLEQTRAAWESQARAYDEAITPVTMEAARVMLRMAGVGPGTRLIDIAAGGGAASIPAAELGASVTAIDYSAGMVDLLARKALDLGLTQLEAIQMDGTALQFEDGTFDVACSQLGIMLFPDRARGLSEMYRVVRGGGVGAMGVFGPPDRVQPLSLFYDALSEAMPAFTAPQQSPLFCLEDPTDLKRELELAGFREVQVERFEATMGVRSGRELWDKIIAGAPAITGLVKSTPVKVQQDAMAALDGLVGSRVCDGDMAHLPMAFNMGVGVK